MPAYTVDQLVWMKRHGGWRACCYVSGAPGGRHIVSEAFGSTSINYSCDDKDLCDCTVDPVAFDAFNIDLESLVPPPVVINLAGGSPVPTPPPFIIDLSCSSPTVINLITDDQEVLEPLMVVGQKAVVEFNGTQFGVRIDAVHQACRDSGVSYDVVYSAGTFELNVTADRFGAK